MFAFVVFDFVFQY